MAKGKSKGKSKGKGKGKTSVLRGGLPELVRQAHRIQTKLDQMKEEIKEVEWTTEAAGGKVKATINGARELVRVEIDKELVNPEDCETLQDVVVSAVNAALTTAEEKINEATEKITGGMTVPGIF